MNKKISDFIDKEALLTSILGIGDLSPVRDFKTFKEAIDYCDELTYD